MKSLIVLSTIALVALVAAEEEWKPQGLATKNPEIHEQCFAESGLVKEDLPEVLAKQGTEERQKKGQEYVLCVMKKKGIFTEESGYNFDRVVAELIASHLEEEKARELATKCVDNNEQKSTPAARAFRFVECMYKNHVDDLLIEAEKAHNMRNRDSATNDSERR